MEQANTHEERLPTGIPSRYICAEEDDWELASEKRGRRDTAIAVQDIFVSNPLSHLRPLLPTSTFGRSGSGWFDITPLDKIVNLTRKTLRSAFED